MGHCLSVQNRISSVHMDVTIKMYLFVMSDEVWTRRKMVISATRGASKLVEVRAEQYGQNSIYFSYF